MFKSLTIATSVVTTLITTTAMGATLTVANNGIDSALCGAFDSPCRSITQAITIAADGDEIVVGPGLYGDVNGDGVLTPGTGDEFNGGPAMIEVAKSVSIISRSGAAATLIKFVGGGAPTRRIALLMLAPDIRFGGLNRGFTVIGGGGDCTAAVLNKNPAPDAIVEGNIITSCGIAVMASGANLTVADNRIFANGDGIVFSGTGALVRHNSVISNSESGIQTVGFDWTIVGNVVTDSRVGARIDGSGLLALNTFAANEFGIQISSFYSPFVSTVIYNSFYASTSNCAVDNNTGALASLPNNFWGDANGPGEDPADDLCGIGSIDTPDPLAVETPITLKAIR